MTDPFSAPAHAHMTSPIYRVGTATTGVEVDRLLDAYDVSALGVVDDAGALVGVVSRTDLLRSADAAWGAAFDVPDAPAATLMTPRPVRIRADRSLRDVARAMVDGDIHRVFVEWEGEVVGVISTRDLMEAAWRGRCCDPAMDIARLDVPTLEVSAPLALAADRLDEVCAHGLVVVDAGWPVGTFSQRDALSARAHDPRTPIERLMNTRMAIVAPTTPLHRVARQATALDLRRVVVMEDDAIVGLVSSFDFARFAAGSAARSGARPLGLRASSPSP